MKMLVDESVTMSMRMRSDVDIDVVEIGVILSSVRSTFKYRHGTTYIERTTVSVFDACLGQTLAFLSFRRAQRAACIRCWRGHEQ